MTALARLTFVVNGKRKTVAVPPMKRLLDVLRTECGLTGTKEGCGEGECGACSVLLDGQSVNSCLVPAIHADGRTVVTVEGLARGKALTRLQTAFVTMGGAQCGICTPGILISAHELLAKSKGKVPSEDEVREALAGNLCRCTGYQKIVDAVRAAATPGKTARTSGHRRTGAKQRAVVRARRTSTSKKRAARKPARTTSRRVASKRGGRR